MTLNSKIQIYNALLAGLSKGVKLAAELDRKGRVAERREVEARNEKLAKKASALRAKIHKKWSLQAAKITDEIRRSNTALQRRIADIDETIKNAEKFVKTLGYLDDIIGIATKVLGAVL